MSVFIMNFVISQIEIGDNFYNSFFFPFLSFSRSLSFSWVVLGVLNSGVIIVHSTRALSLLNLWWDWPAKHPEQRVRMYLEKWSYEQQSLVR